MLLALLSQVVTAQGPPITGDKPLMLGGKTILVKTLSEFRKTELGESFSLPVMVHYLPTANTLVGVHIPTVYHKFDPDTDDSGPGLGDIALLGKYMFHRKDGMGKTFRIVAKTLQTLPSGRKLGIEGISTGQYQGYYGFVAGLETIKYGISNELGYNHVPESNLDELRYKLGFGLPLLKQQYPVNQINLYFEYQSSWYVEAKEYLLLYAQGIQYAKGRLTLETSLQLPLIQTFDEERNRIYSLFVGTRYAF